MAGNILALYEARLKKLIQIGAYVLAVALQATLCSAECVDVQPIPSVSFESGPVVRLGVVNEDKPVAGANVEFYLFDSGDRPEKPTLTLVSDEFGWIKSPKLSDGRYEVVATAEHNLRADLRLEISSQYGSMAFKMELLPGPPRDADPETATLAQVPIGNDLELFRGRVVDPTGAAIPGVRIRIFRRGVDPRKVVETLEAGKAGEFETKLDAGSYVASFSAQGFAVKLVGFEIVSPDSGPLTVILDIGSC